MMRVSSRQQGAQLANLPLHLAELLKAPFEVRTGRGFGAGPNITDKACNDDEEEGDDDDGNADNGVAYYGSDEDGDA